MGLNNFDTISELLFEELENRFHQENEIPNRDIEFSDNFAEVLEKLFILHIRMWKLEDAIAQATTDEELAALKRKSDDCFKNKRPKLIRVINLMLDDYIKKKKQFTEENPKLYKGFNN